MADGNMRWDETHAKRIERFANMSLDDWAKRNAKAMLDLEIIWHLAESRLCDLAGDDRTGDTAQLSAEAGEVFHSIKALHRHMDRVAASAMSLPVTQAIRR